ncbi:MAG: YtxH domain-containing protein [Spirosomataceae bacterium]|jgi:gas vesicle protein
MINTRVFWGIVTAAAAGAVIGLLFAPDEGRKTRRKIRNTAEGWSHDALDSLDSSKKKVLEAAQRLKDTALKAKQEAKEAIQEATEKV